MLRAFFFLEARHARFTDVFLSIKYKRSIAIAMLRCFSFIGSADICKTYLRPSGTASGCTRRLYTASEKAAIRFHDASG